MAAAPVVATHRLGLVAATPPRPAQPAAGVAGDRPDHPREDRYSAYAHLPPERRQVCWGHLIRDFQAMVDRGDAGSAIGLELLLNSDVMFDAWSKVRAGTASRRTFATRTLPWLRREVRTLLRLGPSHRSPKTAATCRQILKVEPSLWTFAKVEGVEPTDSAAERALRHTVCWRKTGFGTESAAGSRFVERMLTTVESCRRQSRDLLAFLVEAIGAHRSGDTPLSLLPAGA